MKKIIIYVGFLTLLVSLSCTKNFADINTSTKGLPASNNANNNGGGSSNNDNLSTTAMLQTMMTKLYDGYQTEQELSADIFAGYMGTATNFVGNNQNQIYLLVDGWNGQMFTNWTEVMKYFVRIQSATNANNSDTNRAVLGMAYVVNVLCTQWAGDYYGALPYTTFGNTNGSAYNSLQTVYEEMFKKLDTALTFLDATKTATTGVDNTTDLFYEGNQEQWIKLANSLRLRIAMRIINVDPTMAQAQVQKATNNTALILTNNDNAAIHSALFTNQLWTIVHSWTDGRLAADIVCYLLGYEDPRLTVYADMVETRTSFIENAGLKYVGVRVGTQLVAKVPYFYSGIGSYAPANIINPSYAQSPLPFFVAAETNFLLAEAALRGWVSTNTAENYYKQGVTLSMNQWNITDATAINTYLNSTKTEADFVDPSIPEANIAAVSTCVPKWNATNTFSNEQLLEQIITQKWIATWPACGPNAWAEYRRTGYPILFPPYYAAIFPTIPFTNGRQVNAARKLRLPTNEYTNNKTNVDNAVATYFNGVDAISTRVWWDVNPTPL